MDSATGGGVRKQTKGVHRFMLNLKPHLYEQVRSSSHMERASMSSTINDIIEDYYQTKGGESDDTNN